MSGRFVLRSSANGKFRFNLCAGNGQVILTSEPYNSKKSALDGIALVSTHAVNEGSVERKVSKNGQPYFNLTSTGGRVIGTSQMYSSRAAMEKGIRSVVNNADSRIHDHAASPASDMTGVPAELAHDPELVRSWRAAEADLRDPAVRARVTQTLKSLDGSSKVMDRAEFLASTEYSVA